MKTGTSSLFLGTFNSEYFWTDRGSASLPAVFDPQADAVISAMDELQVVFCRQPTDILITRHPLDQAFKNYFTSLGFDFSCNISPMESNCRTEDRMFFNQNICRLLLNGSVTRQDRQLMAGVSRFSPYSCLPFSGELCSQYRIQDSVPSHEAVRTVNSKLYSHGLSKHLFKDDNGRVVHSAAELDIVGKELLAQTHFLVKEPYGVSGKGNILIDGEAVLNGVVRYLKKQERKGKETAFLVEKLLDKQLDISCQFEIKKNGSVDIISVQQMHNNGFAFAGIESVKADLFNHLEQLGYPRQVELIAQELSREGYYGPVCLDSMILRDGTLVPVIEINARKSMGLINHHLDLFLEPFSAKGNLMYFSLGLAREVPFEELLDKLKKKGLLFEKEHASGLLPLSANTLNINKPACPEERQERFAGRLYFSAVAQKKGGRDEIVSGARQVLTELDCRVLN